MMNSSLQIFGSSLLGTLKKKCTYQQFVRYASALKRATAELDEYVSKAIEGKEIKPRKHPGIMPHAPYTLPKPVKNCITNLLNDGPKKQLLEESNLFKRYLLSRQLPKEEDTIMKMRSSIEAEVKDSMNLDPQKLNEEELKRYNEIKESKVNTILRQRVYNWKKLDFTKYSGLLYLITRSAAEYSAVSKVLTEIAIRSSIKPKRIFDFGSGLGSVIWAVNNIWGKSISEYYCVDSCSTMLELLETIIKEYDDEKLSKKIFTRQFLPSSNEITSDIVVSAYSFIELPTAAARLETLKNLWNRTTQFLVLIETGTLAGFKIINEARDYLLSAELNEGGMAASVFSPCPHDFSCPRTSTKSICSFQSSYYRYPQIPELLKNESFTYLVVQKGPRDTTKENWPRIVQPVLRRSRHAVCRFCTSEGQLKEVVFSPAKHGQITYRCAKSSSWGDLFPCKIVEKDDKAKNTSSDNQNLSSDEKPF